MFQISNRLKTIASYVKPYRYVVDVGTDHCLVPIYLIKNNLIDGAIATDINEGPVNEAMKNIHNYQMDAKINVRLGNGLEIISQNDSTDVIIVAGMGGKLIRHILETGKHILQFNNRLILQPNVNEETVRQWLCENHYEIVFEEIIKEENVFYEIIVADKRKYNIQYTNDEIVFGPILLTQRNRFFIEKWQSILNHKKEIYNRIPKNHQNKKWFFKSIKQIQSILESSKK